MEGTIIAERYRLLGLLGKGAMGSVWRAQHISLGTPVAVKLINAELATQSQARVRFVREAQLAAKIRNAHVTQVHDHGDVSDGGLYIAMECLEGESLADRLTARGRLTLAETARVISHASRGLARAHDIGLVHRDIKPDNLFIAREGAEEILKVLDFGVAKAVDALGTEQDRTRTGALVGTPFYMSPEQAQGLKDIDSRSDLWSLGVVAFECLTGTMPFSAPALGPLIAAILARSIPIPSQVVPDAGIPREVDEWMARALSRAPADRFQSAEEMSEAFAVASGTMESLRLDGNASSQPPRPSAAVRVVPTEGRGGELDATVLAPPPKAEAVSPPVTKSATSRGALLLLVGSIFLTLAAVAATLLRG